LAAPHPRFRTIQVSPKELPARLWQPAGAVNRPTVVDLGDRAGESPMFDVRRREFLSLLGGAAAACPLAARAQQTDRMQRIGVLMGYAESNVEGQAFVAAFREELLKLGWAEGRNLRSEYRWAPPGDAEATRGFAKELVTLQPNLILAHNTAATAAALERTHTIPILFAIVADPVGSGFAPAFHARAATSPVSPRWSRRWPTSG